VGFHFGAQHIAEAAHGVFGGPVGGVAVYAHETGDGGDVHDAAFTAAGHLRGDGPAGVHGPEVVDLHHPAKNAGVHVQELARMGHAGAVDQQIRHTVPVHERIQSRLHFVVA